MKGLGKEGGGCRPYAWREGVGGKLGDLGGKGTGSTTIDHCFFKPKGGRSGGAITRSPAELRAEVPPTNSPSELKKKGTGLDAWTPQKIVSSHQHKYKQGKQFWSKALLFPVSWRPKILILWWGPIRILGPRSLARLGVGLSSCSVFWCAVIWLVSAAVLAVCLLPGHLTCMQYILGK